VWIFEIAKCIVKNQFLRDCFTRKLQHKACKEIISKYFIVCPSHSYLYSYSSWQLNLSIITIITNITSSLQYYHHYNYSSQSPSSPLSSNNDQWLQSPWSSLFHHNQCDDGDGDDDDDDNDDEDDGNDDGDLLLLVVIILINILIFPIVHRCFTVFWTCQVCQLLCVQHGHLEVKILSLSFKFLFLV